MRRGKASPFAYPTGRAPRYRRGSKDWHVHQAIIAAHRAKFEGLLFYGPGARVTVSIGRRVGFRSAIESAMRVAYPDVVIVHPRRAGEAWPKGHHRAPS